MTILAIHYTPRPESRTKRIFDAVVAKKSGDIKIRTISDTDLPLITSSALGGLMSGSTDTAFSKLSIELIEEIQTAEEIIIATPLYNFGVPAAVKAYVDLVTIAGKTFKYTEEGAVGLLSINKATIVSTSGGVPFGSPVDHLTPYLKTIVNFWSTKDVEFTEYTAEALNTVSEEEADAIVDKVIAGI